MGRYITWADVSNKYGDFAKGPDATQANSLHVPAAEAEVDGYMAVRYTVPFSPAPYVVRDLCVDIAYYKATIRQEGSKLLKDYIDDRVKAIINGTLLLTNSDGALSAPGSTPWASNSYHSAVGFDNEVNWSVDSQQIQDLQNLRGQL